MTNPLSSDLNHILEHTRELWEDLRGERIFITGGTGFFGKWILESLLWANDRLSLECRATVLSRSPDVFQAEAPHLAGHELVSVIQGNVCTFDFPPGTFSHIIHAATHTHPRSAPPNALALYGANVRGTQHTLDFAATCHAKRFLFTSSGAVYGKQPPELTHISEDYPGAPATTEVQTAYGQSKRASEFLCTLASISGLQVKIARCFAFVGPHLPLDSNYAIGNFVRNALDASPIIIQGDGTPYRSYLYAADLAIWLWTILFKGKPVHPYNVGSDADLTIAQLAAQVVKNLRPHLQIKILRRPELNKPAQRYVPSIQRAKDELGLDVKIQLPEAIHRMSKFYSQYHL
jgi:nucleoside-diphosphate-sugar epimerase